MKKYILLVAGLLFFISSCKNDIVKKPDNLLSEDQMVDMIYDLSILDAMRQEGVYSQQETPTQTELLKTKYKTDSITFAKNTLYYASDIRKYKRIYESVKDRLDKESIKLEGKKAEKEPEEGVVN